MEPDARAPGDFGIRRSRMPPPDIFDLLRLEIPSNAASRDETTTTSLISSKRRTQQLFDFRFRSFDDLPAYAADALDIYAGIAIVSPAACSRST